MFNQSAGGTTVVCSLNVLNITVTGNEIRLVDVGKQIERQQKMQTPM